MSRLIDADVEKQNEIVYGFDDAPTADVEIVLCVNCKYYQKIYGGVPLGEVGHCICHSFETVPGWFCADGERMEVDE